MRGATESGTLNWTEIKNGTDVAEQGVWLRYRLPPEWACCKPDAGQTYTTWVGLFCHTSQKDEDDQGLKSAKHECKHELVTCETIILVIGIVPIIK